MNFPNQNWLHIAEISRKSGLPERTIARILANEKCPTFKAGTSRQSPRLYEETTAFRILESKIEHGGGTHE